MRNAGRSASDIYLQNCFCGLLQSRLFHVLHRDVLVFCNAKVSIYGPILVMLISQRNVSGCSRYYCALLLEKRANVCLFSVPIHRWQNIRYSTTLNCIGY